MGDERTVEQMVVARLSALGSSTARSHPAHASATGSSLSRFETHGARRASPGNEPMGSVMAHYHIDSQLHRHAKRERIAHSCHVGSRRADRRRRCPHRRSGGLFRYVTRHRGAGAPWRRGGLPGARDVDRHLRHRALPHARCGGRPTCRARGTNGLGGDGERPLRRRRGRPRRPRPSRRLAACTRDHRCRVVPARTRPSGARPSPGAGNALVPHAAGRLLRRGRPRHRVAAGEERQAADRRGCSTC